MSRMLVHNNDAVFVLRNNVSVVKLRLGQSERPDIAALDNVFNIFNPHRKFAFQFRQFRLPAAGSVHRLVKPVNLRCRLITVFSQPHKGFFFSDR